LLGRTLVTLKEAAEYAPLVTASVAALAPLVAVVSILVQKGIARKRAAIDFFLKTEMESWTRTFAMHFGQTF